ncbi:MAG: tail fiber domain-containing protein, partial [Bacteroidota bacterium]|nr:tail fiber domain-containing protein [Bacteroidota bacterium]
NIRPLTNSLSNVLALQGIYYNWKKESFPEKQFDDKGQIGFAAQELEKIFPEMVHTDAEGYKTVDYSKMAPVLVEAIKEQQTQIAYLLKELAEIKKAVGEARDQ